MSNEISTAFYDVMFGSEENNSFMNKIEQQTSLKVREILNSPEKLSSKIPPLPVVLIELVTILKEPNADFLDFVKVIEKDPSLAIEILKVANTAMYNRTDKTIDSLRKAVGILGVTGVAKIASTIVMKEIMPQKPIYHKMFGQQIWQHCLYCASMCQILAPAHNEDMFEAHFLGLIHDVGKILIFNCLCESFSSADVDSKPGGLAFKNLMSEMSVDISYFIALEWQLPAIYVEALGQQRGKQESNLAKILFNANLLSEVYLLYQHNVTHEEQISDLLNRMSLDEGLWQEFIDQTKEIKAA